MKDTEKLHRQALFYLARYSVSCHQLRQVLRRKAANITSDSVSETEIATLVEAEIERLQHAGYLDDAHYAEAEVRRLRRKGKAARFIVAHLRRKGVAEPIFRQALADDEEREGEDDRCAARRLAHKRKIGPWRVSALPKDPTARHKILRRESGILARAGFAAALAREIILSDGVDD